MPLEHTSSEAIAEAHKVVHATFLTGKARPLEWRKQQLKQLAYLLQENADAFIKALESDLNRPAAETITAELEPLKGEVLEVIHKLGKWAKPQKADTNLIWWGTGPTIHKEPKGAAVLIIGAWNFPVALLLGPLIGAIAAGCTAVVKPSEQSPATATVVATLLPKYLDSSAYQVVNGAVKETSQLLELRWDHIFYTGSGKIGRIIAKAAAEHLTPTTLELGGKSPAVVFDDANFEVAARRLIWGKHVNSGQICIAPDYVLVSEKSRPKLVKAMEGIIQEFNAVPAGQDVDANFSRLVTKAHFDRLSGLLSKSKGKVLIGGGTNEAKNKIDVTVVQVDSDDSLMSEEIFGPILPILTIESKEEAAKFIAARDNPLALYVFTNSSDKTKYIFEHTRSGGFVRNDVLVQFMIPGLPFGGHGASGSGNYHGKASFDCFSHERAFAHVPFFFDKILALRYPPYSPSKLKYLLLAMGVKIKGQSGAPAQGPGKSLGLAALFAALALAWRYKEAIKAKL